ncbi:MAG: hypothetical protein OEZ23_04225, partial [Gammaproteobacteria bacterium]|nr:hypothetical protein [Gammaproteobacteria bacterium]
SAVQFTRNPRGIAGALKRIGGYDPGAGIDNPKAEEIQHALFASSFNQVFLSMMSTHPPLEDRIKRIDPDWDGEFEYVDQTDQGRGGSGESMVSGFAGGSQAASLANAVDQIGELTAENIVYARELIDGIPEAIYRSVREPWSSRAVIYSLLLSNDNEVCNRQLEHLHNAADEGVFQEVINLAESFEETDIKMRLPIIELAMPALRQLSLPQRRLFKNNMNALVAADGRVDPFEWSLQRIVTTALDASERHKNVPARYGSFHRLKEPVSLLLSIMLYTCKIDEADHKRMMEDAGAQLGTDLYLCHRKDLSLKKLDAAVDKLRQLKPLKKPALLKACVQIVAAGTDETSTGREMLRAVADIMDCPMPPLS